MKETAIELLNLVALHCPTEESSAYETLNKIDDFNKEELKIIILFCLDELKREIQTY